jgi:molybdopterin-biosynthesis enzyme MoeA-like protein
MTGMLEDVGPRLKGGTPVVSRTLRVEGVGEGTLAEPLAAAARAHRELSLGSYPFFDAAAGRYGSNLVVRGRTGEGVETALAELEAALRAAGVEAISHPD